jgi:hypothetical protein
MTISILIVAHISSSNAQTIANKSIADISKNLPKPPESLEQSINLYGKLQMGEIPEAFRKSLNELSDLRENILKSLYDKLVAAGKGNIANYSPDEQKLLRDIQTLRSSWGDGVMYGFKVRIEYRPGIAKQFWSRPRQPISSTAQDQYKRLVQIEQSLNWLSFLEEARKHEELVFHDSKLDAIDAEKIQALSAVPTKKQRFAEGSDVMVDLPDREKTIEVMKNYDAKKMKIFSRVYNEQIAWWKTNYLRIETAANSLDSILRETQFGESLQGQDAQLRTAIADVQERIVGLLSHLTNIGSKIISISQQAYTSTLATEEYIKNSY